MSTATAATGNEAPPKGKGKLLLIIGAIVVMAAGAGGTWFYMSRQKADETVEKPVKKVPPVFVNLDPFTVNLADREHYLQVGLVYEVAGSEVAEAIKASMPVIRSKVLLLLTSKQADELISSEGKEKLAEGLLTVARESLDEKHAESVNRIHFASFVIQ